MTTAAEWLVQAASLSAQDKTDIAAATLAAAQVTPIKADVDKVKGLPLSGTGVPPTFDANGVMTDPGDPFAF